jgi:hypothetical protein
MPDGIRWVGLDVHARESTVAVFDQASGEVLTRRVVGRPHELLGVLREVPRPARMVYEAGPTGYGLARRAQAVGIELGVCAPSKTERPPADRIKTDKRDAIRLARLLAAGELTLVTIPSVEREQLRDLVRCREDIRVDLMRARHRLGNLLLRREIYWEGPGEAWSRRHRSWLTSVRFSDHASQATLADYLHAHDVLIARRDQVEADLAKVAVSAPCAQAVARLRCLRGIDTLSALGLCAEIGEWGRSAIIPTSSPPTSGSSPQSTPPAPSAGSGRSPRPAPPTPGGCWSRPPTTTAAAPRSARRSSAANAGNHPTSSISPGAHSAGSTPAQRRTAQTQRDRRRRDRPRTRRLLLGDRHLDPSSRPDSADIPAGGRPPHARSLAPTQAHPNRPQEAHQLALMLTTRCG